MRISTLIIFLGIGACTLSSFTSNKSSLVELCEWFALNYGLNNPFTGSVLNIHNVSLNKQARYTDMMFYKFVA